VTREQKLKRDAKTVKKYAEECARRRKVYMRHFSAYAVNQRRTRAGVVGDLVLRAIEDVKGLAHVHPLIAGTLEYGIKEQKCKDPDDHMMFHYEVTYHVLANEDAMTAEEQKQEVTELAEKLRRETNEMFPDDPGTIIDKGMDPDPEQQACPPMPKE